MEMSPPTLVIGHPSPFFHPIKTGENRKENFPPASTRCRLKKTGEGERAMGFVDKAIWLRDAKTKSRLVRSCLYLSTLLDVVMKSNRLERA